MDQGRHTRRQLLKAALGGAAGIALGAPVRLLAAGQALAVPTTVQLADDLFIVTAGGINVLARTGAGGVVLVDGGSAASSAAVLKAVAGLPGASPVRTLFNTHWHPEQTGSNQTLAAAGAQIVAHENTRLWLSTDVKWPWNGQTFRRLPKAAQPNKTFYTSGTLEPGIKYGYMPDCAHTDGDLYVSFERQNVLAVGDVVSGQGWPTVDYITGGWIGGTVGGVQRLLAVANEQTRIVPAHGPVLTLADLKAQAGMYATIYERLSTLLNRGRSPSEAVAAKPTKEFDAQMGNPDEFVRRAFESLWAYLSPDA
ncbi:MAG TPA: MBL fold metallo-hydrolase [Vicinamibacterales bacterium]|nr:MBL fold metallo-hydrolase [Vicinamibacterales bacterium]